MRTAAKLKTLAVATALVGAVLIGGYALKSHLTGDTSAVQAAPAPQAVPVAVIEVESAPVQLWSEFSGRLSAVDYVDLRPQVSGRIKEVLFEDGQMVSAGAVLVVIDPRPYEAAVADARAELEAARHTLALAEKQRRRAESLIGKGHISKSLLDERVSDHTVAVSRVNGARAKLNQAEIDLGHAYVESPINGRLSRAEITEGNLVEAGPNAPVLTSIVSTQDIYADFDVDERTYLRHVHALAKAGGNVSAVPVELIIDAGEQRVYRGHIQSFDNRIDPATGTIRARAIFANEDGSLLPGMFAEVRLGNPDAADVILLASSAIGTDQDRKYVYVVDETDMVAYREVILGASVGGQRVIAQGLQNGERVVVEGLMKVRPGMAVVPHMVGEDAPTALSEGPGAAQSAAN